MQEEELIERARQHDEEAFRELYQANFDRVYRYLRLKVGSKMEAEDLTQQVFLKAYKGLGSYSYRKVPFGAWLMRIAHNEMVDYYRKRSRCQMVALDDVTLVAPEDPARITEALVDIERLKESLTRLNPAQQEVILLRFGSGLSLAEVAQIMGRSVGAVKMLQHNALVALRKAIRGGDNKDYE